MADDPKTGAEPPRCGSFITTRAGWPANALIRDRTKQTTSTIVKTIEALAIVASLGLISGSAAFAQGRTGGKPKKQPDFAQVVLKQLSEGYASIAPFDTNKDGKLNATEEDAIADALKDGSLKLPIPPMPPPPPPPQDGAGADAGPPPGMMPPIEEMLPVIASLYEAVAALDADQNGSLDDNEKAALKKAFEGGKLPLPPAPPHHGGPPMGEHPAGPGGPRP